jgi:hypothetical protein
MEITAALKLTPAKGSQTTVDLMVLSHHPAGFHGKVYNWNRNEKDVSFLKIGEVMGRVKDHRKVAFSYEDDNSHRLATIDFHLAAHYKNDVDCSLFLLRSNGKKKARTLVKQYDLTLDSVFVAEWKNKQNMKMVDVVGSVSRFVEV